MVRRIVLSGGLDNGFVVLELTTQSLDGFNGFAELARILLFEFSKIVGLLD